ncbi:MAG: hypothetical protein IKV79_05575, partial [Oscillospiraceae bacterium]|nr:hypothetical protein [Oscillospiraceae bacterium]
MTNGNYQYSLVEKLSFTRYGGTEAELKAAEILKKEAESFGGEAQLMNFTIPAFDFSHCSLRVTAPYEKEYDCAPCGMVGCINKELKLIYVEQGTDFDLRKYDDLSEYAVIINELNKETYKRLALKKAGAFIAFKGKWYSRDEDVDIIPRPIRPGMLKNG